MNNKLYTMLLVGSCLTLPLPALAQTAPTSAYFGKSTDDGRKRLAAPSYNELKSSGQSGVVTHKSMSLEAGGNSNVDQFFGDANDSPYGKIDSNVILGYITESGASTLAVKGQMLQYDEDVNDNTRWDAGVAVDNDYQIYGGLRMGAGAYFLRDETELIPLNELGGYTSLNFNDNFWGANVVGRIDNFDYIGAYPLPGLIPPGVEAFARPGEYSYLRSEMAGNVITFQNEMVSPYAEVGGANIDYTDQKIPGLLDRDAREAWALAGLRFKPDATVVIDAGWRVNRREFDDAVTRDFDSNFFDGKVIWAPGSTFLVRFEVDRSIQAPIALQALATDQISYSLTTEFRPADNFSISPYARFRNLDQIGDASDFEETTFGVASELRLRNNVTLYGQLQSKTLEEKATGADMEQIQGGLGVRLKF